MYNKRMFSRKLFELCLFTYLAAELKSGDLAVEGSEKYADYREQLLPWSECERILDAYCTEVGLPRTAQGLSGRRRVRRRHMNRPCPAARIWAPRSEQIGHYHLAITYVF